jgi:formylglycine-generating enzyme required for sulfatase activity
VRKNILFVILAFLLSITACAVSTQTIDPCTPGSMVFVPAGWFSMGQDEGRRSNQPRRRVYLDAYAIDCTEVTNAAFGLFVADVGYVAAGWDASLAEEHADEPVAGLLWAEADAYCRWRGDRLPTEAEWEKAARGEDGRCYPWGDEWDAEATNTLEGGRGGVAPVGSYPGGASPYGVLDMAGNVAEWVSDYFDFAYYSYAPDRNPQEPEEVLDHGIRGGSWASPPEHALTFFRDSSHSVLPNWRVGFRCATGVVSDE